MTYRWQCPDNGSDVFSPTCHHGYQASSGVIKGDQAFLFHQAIRL